MSKEKIFISEDLLRAETPKTSAEYLNRELKEDISVFSEKEKELIFKKIGGGNLISLCRIQKLILLPESRTRSL